MLLRRLLQKYRAPGDFESFAAWSEILQTWVVWGISLALVLVLEGWKSVIPGIILSIASVRAFVAFHDLCHLSFFQSRTINLSNAHLLAPIAGRSVVNWMHGHNGHHHTLGDNSAMDFSLTVHFSIEQMTAWPCWKRVLYRIIRDPFVYFVLAPIWAFFIVPFCRDLKNSWPRIVIYGTVYLAFGPAPLKRMVFFQWFAGFIGVFLFHLQHQCNQPYRVPTDRRTRVDAGLWGSTYVLIPWALRWMTLGIEFHHIHHACTLVPGYKMSKCHEEGEREGLWERAGINVVGPKRAFLSCFHSLFDKSPSLDGKTGCLEPRFVAFEPYRSLGLQDYHGGAEHVEKKAE